MNIDTPKAIFSSFGHQIIFLFLAGFILARAFQVVGLDRRISLYLLTRSFIKGSFTRLIFTLICVTTMFTMWINNTATTAMMLPLVLGVLNSLDIKDKKITSFVLIAVAYASSIGGIATPIGSTPNIIAIGILKETIGLKVTFLEWIYYSLPITITFILTLIILTTFRIKHSKVEFNNNYLLEEYKKLSQMSREEIYTGIIFLLTIITWILPSFFKLFEIKTSLNLDPGAVGLFFSSFLFLFPFGKKKILQASAIKTIDWSSLMLFGAGLAFGKLLFNLGLAQLAGDSIISLIQGMPLFIIFLSIFGFVIFATELTSNTATANILIPIMISLAQGLKIDPLVFTMGISFSCSLAFMLPVATPPNAIVFGSEKVFKSDMIINGFILNITYSLLLAGILYLYQLYL